MKKLIASLAALMMSLPACGPEEELPPSPEGDASLEAEVSSLPEQAGLPAAARVHTVSNSSGLQSKVSAAAPGDHIVLEDGSYGRITLSRSFPADRPLVIRAANQLRASASSLAISGSGLIVSGVAVSGGGIDISGSNVRVTRCSSRGAGSVVSIDKGSNILVDHCELSHYSYRGISVSPPANKVILARNYVHDSVGSEVLSALALGGTNNDRLPPINAVVRYNYFERHSKLDYVHIKSSGNTIAFNTFIKADNSNEISIRHGRDNAFIGNNAPGIQFGIRDYNSTVFGNRGGSFTVYGGDVKYTYEELPGKHDGLGWSTQPAARNTRLAGNTGRIEVGTHYSQDCDAQPTPADGVKIHQHSGGVDLVSASCITWHRDVSNQASQPAPASWGTLPTPTNLSKADVGPHSR